MKKKVLLLNPPGERLYLRDCYCSTISKADYYWHPLDLLVQSGILSKDYDVLVLDANVLGLRKAEALERISQMDLDTILFLMGSASWQNDIGFLKELKKRRPSVKFVGSGDVLRFHGSRVMEEFPFIDAVLLDFTSGALLDFMAGKGNGRKVTSLIYRHREEIITGDIGKELNFEIPVPKHELFPLSRYKLPFGKRRLFASTFSTYGCPYKCKFCNTGVLNFKKRGVDNFIEELKYIRGMGIDKVFIRDPTFGADREHATEACEKIIENNLAIQWNCYSRADVLEEDLLKLMKKAGCYLVGLGVESGNEQILERYNKRIAIEKTRKAFELCRKYRIETVAHFILGLPGADRGSTLSTIALARSLGPSYAAFNLATPRFGSSFREECLQQKWISSDSYAMDSSCSFPVIETGTLSKEELWRLRNRALRSFYLRPSYILKRISSIHDLGDILTLLEGGLCFLRGLKRA